MFHNCCSFKLHATSRQLHAWTRSEKTKLKEHAAEIVKEQADLGSEKLSRTEAEDAETFEGDMDNFQTPLVRRGHRPFLYVQPHG